MKISRDLLCDIIANEADGYSTISEGDSPDNGSSCVITVFMYKQKYYEVAYREDSVFGIEDSAEFNCTEVEPFEVMRTEYKPVVKAKDTTSQFVVPNHVCIERPVNMSDTDWPIYAHKEARERFETLLDDGDYIGNNFKH